MILTNKSYSIKSKNTNIDANGIENIYIKARQVKAIDTTGAGDAFNGGFTLALLKGKKIKECLELANRVAGLSTTKLGAGDSMPTLNELN